MVVSKKLYEHFPSLTKGISILLDTNNEKRNAYMQYAKELLTYFVYNSSDIYSEAFVVYNVHCLIHLPDDALNFSSSFNKISAFPFENYLRTLKHIVRNAQNPIVKISKKLFEIETHKLHNFQRKNFNLYRHERKIHVLCYIMRISPLLEKRETILCMFVM